ncbi:hypothetical protein BCB68_09350 [Leptotrichia sp. oral taxon 498]|uniref:DUF4272 domain-containing protein n=1 Tax=Leptotrichia sp. oral taxon 498 TaxID=712368 RepID=UPI000B8C709F|nr:DUF4272 domain-containing protein [Leptotrichia sp. oral taxon 498]ASQ49113.1 hypothetical protein BCB68_09350 [Leptotrichia sp. oral taxon 498]
MGVLEFFRKKRKERLIICFSKDKTEEKILKNFFEAYADKIKSVTNEADKEITSKTKKFFLVLKNDRKLSIQVNPSPKYILETEFFMELFLEKLKFETFKNLNEKEISKYTRILIAVEMLNKNKRDDDELLRKKVTEFFYGFQKFLIAKRLKHYHYDKKNLVRDEEKWDFSDFIPPLSEKMFENFEQTKEDADRMERNIKLMEKDKMPFYDKMEVNISEKDVKIRKKWEIIRKVVAIVITRIASQTFLEKKENMLKNLNDIIGIFEKKYQFKEFLTKREREFLENKKENYQLNVEFYFRLETAQTLLWVLSIDKLPDLNNFSDLAEIIEILENENLKSFARKCEIRSKNQILDVLDYMYRLNWANVEIKLNGYSRIVNESILYFTRLGLEWVVQSDIPMEEIVIHT